MWKLLVEPWPEEAKGGQPIDPDTFSDPCTGKYFLYMRYGYMAGAELNNILLSLKW